MSARRPVIAVTNESSVLADADVQAAMIAFQHQVDYEFREAWNASALFRWHDKTAPIIPGAWVLALLDDSDQAGALGYHDLTDAGLPMSKVFAKTDAQYGLSWTVTASHEYMEMLGDPYANTSVQVGQNRFWAYENADAVEADELGYARNGVLLSDFVTPDWFVPGSDGPWDYQQHCSEALQILPGGYIGEWTPKLGWQQRTNGQHRGTSPRFDMRRRGVALTKEAA